MNRRKGFMLAVGLLFCGLILLGVSMVLFLRDVRYRRGSKATIGVVTRVTPLHATKSRLEIEVEYRYRDSLGVRHTGVDTVFTDLLPKREATTTNDPVVVVHHPDHPERSRLAARGLLGTAPVMTLILGLIAVVAGVGRLFVRRE